MALLSIVLDAITVGEYTHELGDEGARVLVNNGRVLGKPIKATTARVQCGWEDQSDLGDGPPAHSGRRDRRGDRTGAGQTPGTRARTRRARALEAARRSSLAAVTERVGLRLIAALAARPRRASTTRPRRRLLSPEMATFADTPLGEAALALQERLPAQAPGVPTGAELQEANLYEIERLAVARAGDKSTEILTRPSGARTSQRAHRAEARPQVPMQESTTIGGP